MRSLLSAAILLSTAACGQAKESGFDPRNIVGDWLVQAVFCRDCGDRNPSEIGTEIRIGAATIVNPMGGDCQDDPGFSVFRAISWQEASVGAGILPAQANWIADGRQLVMQGSLTCGGIAYFPLIAINDGMALYPFDGGLTFLLTRKRPAARHL